MNRKTFLIDTNVLLYDPKALSNFENALLIIPIAVFEELDDMKRLPNELGRNARQVMRSFDAIKSQHKNENFMTGIEIGNGVRVQVFSRFSQEMNGQFMLDKTSRKNQVLYSAFMAVKEFPDLIFLSKDFGSRLKAQMTGIKAEDYKNRSFSHQDFYTGLKKAKISKSDLNLFMKNGVLDWNDPEIMANEYCVLSAEDETHVIGRYERHQRQLVALNPLPHDLWSIKPRNIQQRCALDLLLREDVKLVTLVGQAGTGKTLLALACALRKVFDEGTYSKILVSRPIMPLGKDIGFLPGSKEEKLFHWMQPIYDNLEYLCHASSGSQDTQENLRWIKESQKLELEAVTYIRGRTLPNMFIIIDEAQNLTPHEIKTVISRAGEGTKVILAGDPSQIDNPYLDVDTNGLTFAISKFGNHPIFGNMFFDITERSELSSLAAEVL
jgi:PhoH-like ATPase